MIAMRTFTVDRDTARMIFGEHYHAGLDALFEETGFTTMKVLFSLLGSKPASGAEGLDCFMWPQNVASGGDPQARGIDLLDDEGDASEPMTQDNGA